MSFEEKGEDCDFDSNEDEVVPKVDDVSLIDGVLEGAFDGDGDEDFVIGEGIRGGGLGGSHESRSKMKKMMKRMREVTGSIEKIVNYTKNQENTVKIIVTPGGGPLNRKAVPDIYGCRLNYAILEILLAANTISSRII
ncbi:hypothetical protein Tco_0415461 [Tanacetum coccineum]